jgi:hypothetical protein
MGEKITLQNLNALLGRMQRSIGDPGTPIWTRDAAGKNRARVGALALEQGSKVNGIGWRFVQIANESGGQRTLIRGRTARELWDAAQAWLDGFDAAAAQFYRDTGGK